MPAYESTEEYLNSTQIGRQIIRIRENVSDALTAIGAKGVTVPSGSNSDDLATLIGAIQTGGGTPSATQHTILFEFEDETTSTITVYYDSAFISGAITATEPTTYDGKTVQQASLDGVAWYTRPTETWETIYDGNIRWMYEDKGDYPFCWISELGSIPITVGSVWRVTYDNTEYRCTGKTARLNDGNDYNMFGNPGWSGGTDDGSGVPFTFIDYTVYGAWSGGLNIPNVETNCYFKIERLVTS